MANGVSNRIDVYTTTLDNPWQAGHAKVLVGSAKADLEIDAGSPQQTIDGFGGCFNELGWDALMRLPKDSQIKVLNDLFAKDGLALTFGRMPIGANDYSRNYYSCDDVAGDTKMVHFSIGRDREALIPYIKAALAINPRLKIWGSPWCPPAWMKTNGHYAGRPDPRYNDLPESGAGEEMRDQFRLEPEILRAYADYFAKFVEAYAKEGINLFAVMPQNEPNSSQNFPSCVWRPESLALFVGKYLGPTFEARKLKTQIWLGTIERPQTERCEMILNDPDSKRYIRGAGFQWAGMDALPAVRKSHPELKIMQTETMCGDGANDWNAGAATWRQICRNLKNGANAYMYWNLILEEGGISRWGWRQNSPIVVNPKTSTSAYTAEYWAMKHVSRFVPPGSRLLQSSGYADAMAFLTPKKRVVAVLLNDGEARQVSVSVQGIAFEVFMPARSFATVLL